MVSVINSKSLFIIGGTGYVGSSIVKAFVTNNWKVTCGIRNIDKANKVFSELLNDNKEKESLISNISLVIVEDIYNLDNLYKLALDHEVVICAVDRDKTKDKTALVNTLMKAVLKTSEEKKSKFIYCGGCLDYGSSSEVKDESFKFSEKEAFEYVKWRIQLVPKILNFPEENKSSNMTTSVVIPGWVYGLHNGNYISEFLKFCKDNKYVPVSDNLENSMCFTHVTDCAKLFYKVATTEDSKGIYNSCDSQQIKTGEFYDWIADYLKVEKKNEKFEGVFSICLNSDQRIISKRSSEVGLVLEYPSFKDKINKIFEELEL